MFVSCFARWHLLCCCTDSSTEALWRNCAVVEAGSFFPLAFSICSDHCGRLQIPHFEGLYVRPRSGAKTQLLTTVYLLAKLSPVLGTSPTAVSLPMTTAPMYVTKRRNGRHQCQHQMPVTIPAGSGCAPYLIAVSYTHSEPTRPY